MRRYHRLPISPMRWPTLAALGLAACGTGTFGSAADGAPAGDSRAFGDGPARGDSPASDPSAGDPRASDPSTGDPRAADPAASDPASGDPIAPGDSLPPCIDLDSDGRGTHCALGSDCDDDDAGCTTECLDDNWNGVFDCREPKATLDDWWNGSAGWRPAFAMTQTSTGWGYGYGAGAHVAVVGDTWYLFSRQVDWGNKPSACSFMNETLSTQVRRSTDRGQTWSAPTTIIAATPGTAWECAATDGDAWYDAGAGRWHYLFQCIDRNAVWSGCHLVRDAADPAGPFVDPHPGANPVITSKELWDPICDLTSDDCAIEAGDVGRVFDEGTFDLFDFDGTWFWISFHGFDGVRGYRGVARTSDFVTWQAGNSALGLPDDAIFDEADTVGWRESWIANTPIGGGAGRMLREGSTYYLLVEAADVSLACTPGQHWDLGLLRSSSLAATSWQQLPAGNPVIYSSRAVEFPNGGPTTSMPCNVQYGDLFREASGQLWLHYSRESYDPAVSGIYFERLLPTTNLLANGDLWMCTSAHWTAFPIGPTNLVVYRNPAAASQGTCYLATNCGTAPAACQAGQSLYQDIDVTGRAGQRYAFGGRFAHDPSQPDAVLSIVVHELDQASAVVATHSADITTTTTYQPARGAATLAATTRTARFQLYLSSSATTFRADEMYFVILP